MTLFHSNQSRCYRKDDVSGVWVPLFTNTVTSNNNNNNSFWSPLPYSLQCSTKPEPISHHNTSTPSTTYQDVDLCLNFKQETATTFLPWQGLQESQVYY